MLLRQEVPVRCGYGVDLQMILAKNNSAVLRKKVWIFMKDPLGKLLARWQIQKVPSLIDGHFLDIGCGMNELVRS